MLREHKYKLYPSAFYQSLKICLMRKYFFQMKKAEIANPLPFSQDQKI